MALDEAPSVEIEDVSATSAAPAADAVPEAAPVAATPEADTPVAADVGQNTTPPAEPSESREADGNKDINLEQIKADSKPDINHGLVGAAQQAAEHHEQQREAKEEKEKEFEDALDNARDQSKDAQRREREQEEQRKSWEAKTHQMGGVEMSGADLEKLLNFMKSPAAVAKVEAAMKAKGASQKQIEKAQKEWKEYNDLKDKEKSGEQLTPQELKRLQEINKSPEFQMRIQESVNYARSQGLPVDVKKVEGLSTVGANLEEADNGSFAKMREKLQNQEKTTATPPVAASARSDFPSAVPLTSVYNETNAQQVAAAATLANNNNKPQQAPAVAVAAIKPEASSVQAFM